MIDRRILYLDIVDETPLGAGSLLGSDSPLVLQDPTFHARMGRPLSSGILTMFDDENKLETFEDAL